VNKKEQPSISREAEELNHAAHVNIDEARPALLELLQTKSVFRGDFTLSSG